MTAVAPVRIRLFHKGLVLILVPLAFELLFVGGLYYLDSQANAEAARQLRSKEFVAQTNRLSISILQSSYALLSYRALHSTTFLNDYDRIVSGIPDIRSALEQLAAGDPGRDLHVKRLNSLVERILALMKRFRDPPESGAFLLVNPLVFRVDLDNSYRAFLQDVNKINTEESQLQAHGSDAEAAFRSRFHNVLWLGILASVAMTVWLVALFSKHITKRLDVLADNVRQLVRKRQLSEPLGGNDEIVELDHLFHDVARDLRAAEQSKQAYVQMITHDLRTPLTTIQTTLGLLQSGVDREPEAENRRILSAFKNINRMNKMLEDLLDLEKLEAGMLRINPALMDLSEIIEQAIESVKEQAETQGVGIKFEPRRTIVSADQDALTHVCANLLANAVKFSPKGGTVSLTLSEESDRATVSVADEGPGVAPEHRERIFQRFQQIEETGARRSGAGLGLAIAKGLVEAHHGKIGVDKNGGKGSVFWFWIPCN